MISWRRLINSFIDAGRGLKHVFKTEQNFRIQIFFGVLVMVGAIFFRLRSWELIVLVLLVLLVLLVEIFNTAFEKFSDLLKPRLHHYVGVIKDLMAGAVLITSFAALLAGAMIFYPHLVNLLK